MRVALVCDPEVTEVTRAVDAGLVLSAGGDSVAVVTSSLLDSPLAQTVAACGLGLVTVRGGEPETVDGASDERLRFSENVAAVCRTFDIVYFLSGGGSAVHSLRERKLTGSAGPVCAVMLDGSLRERAFGAGGFPDSAEYLSGLAHERYSARHADWVLASSAELATQLRAWGWTIPEPLAIHSRQDWVAAHMRVRETRCAATPRAPRSATIFVLYSDQAERIGAFLRALESQDDPAIVIDFGGGVEANTRPFERARAIHERRGWSFIAAAGFPGAVVNEAVRKIRTDDLIFLDAGYLDPVGLVRKLKWAMEVSGDDCISVPTSCTPGSDGGRGAGSFQEETPGLSFAAFDHPVAVGAADACNGRPAIGIRRDAFHAAGGFLEDGGIDWSFDDLLARLAQRSRRIDVDQFNILKGALKLGIRAKG